MKRVVGANLPQRSLCRVNPVDNIFFLKFKVFNVPSVARNCSIVPQQDVSTDPLELKLSLCGRPC